MDWAHWTAQYLKIWLPFITCKFAALRYLFEDESGKYFNWHKLCSGVWAAMSCSVSQRECLLVSGTWRHCELELLSMSLHKQTHMCAYNIVNDKIYWRWIRCVHIYMIPCNWGKANAHMSWNPQTKNRDFQSNQLTVLPEEIQNLTSLNVLVASGNNIKKISKTFSKFWPQLRTLMMNLNPAECAFYFEPVRDATPQVYCDCTKGYYGIDFCESFAQLNRIPDFASSQGSFQPVDVDQACKDSLVQQSSSFRSSNSFVFCNLSLTEGLNYTVDIPVVQSIFLNHSNQIKTFTAPARTPLNLTCCKISQSFLNPYVPVYLNYNYSGSLPENVSLNSETGILAGSPLNGGTWKFNVSVTGKVTLESMTIGEYTLKIDDCGIRNPTIPQKFTHFCSDNGYCEDTNGEYEGNQTCHCNPGFKGKYCENQADAICLCLCLSGSVSILFLYLIFSLPSTTK